MLRRNADGYRVCLIFLSLASDQGGSPAEFKYRWRKLTRISLVAAIEQETSPALNPAVVQAAGDVVFGRFRFLVAITPVQVRLERGRFPVEGARPVATEDGGERDSPQSRVA